MSHLCIFLAASHPAHDLRVVACLYAIPAKTTKLKGSGGFRSSRLNGITRSGHLSSREGHHVSKQLQLPLHP